MSVFISWRGSDRETKNEMVAYLKNYLGPDEEVWESDEGCKSKSFDEFITQIRKCEVFIVIVSKESMMPSYVINEVIEARSCEMNGTLNMLVYKITDAPYTAEFSAQLNHLTDVNYVARLKNEENSFDKLANRVKELLHKRRSGEPENPYEAFSPEIIGTSLSSGYFVPHSRDDVFEKFDGAFERSNVVFALQLSGYGRKSAVREYALMHSNEYKNIVVLHFFSGSLRSFFTDGIHFSNLDEKIFANLNENELILRKAHLLKKLNKDTLIIVPDYVPDKRDDRFIRDALSQIGCRVVFVSQNIPREIATAFPTVSVGRMKDEHLKTLFFNCYNATNEEQYELSNTLTDFFDSIDGHTKSVEITANVLSDEIGIYPEDIPEILINIKSNGKNELSERIFDLISELFDVTDFSTEEKNILLAASYFARQPIEEKEFIEMLKEAEIYDSQKLSSLVHKRWIDNNRELRTISIEPFLAEVFIAKIPENNVILSKCLSFFSCNMTWDGMSANRNSLYCLINRLKTYCAISNQPELSELFDFAFCAYEDTNTHISSIDNIVALKEKAEQKIRLFDSPELKEQLNSILDFTYSMASFYAGCLNPSTNIPCNDWKSKLMNTILDNGSFMSFFLDDIEYKLDENIENRIKDLMRNVYSNSSGEFLATYIALCETVCQKDSDDLPYDLILMLSLLGQSLINISKNSTYVSLKLCRIWMRMANIFGLHSASAGVLITDIYFSTLTSLDIYTDEFDEVYDVLMGLIDLADTDYYLNDIEKNEKKATVAVSYIYGLVHRKDFEKAIEVCADMFSLTPTTPSIKYNRIKSAKNITDKLLAENNLNLALLFLEKFISKEKELPNENFDNNLIDEAKNIFEDLMIIKASFNNPDTVKPFEDKAENYIDYYVTYNDDRSDKKILKKYLEIAQSAAAQDYSSYSDEMLREKVKSLKKRATSGEKWQNLAPSAFALVSESGYRILGYRHHLVQYIGGAAIVDGKIAEIQNGEGKTYTILLAAFIHFLYGKQVYVIDPSLFLTKRNYGWMRGVLELLGCRVGLLISSDQLLREDFDVIYAELHQTILHSMHSDFSLSKTAIKKEVAIIDEADQVLVDKSVIPHQIISSRKDYNNVPLVFAVEKVISQLTLNDEDRLFSYYQTSGTVVPKPELYEMVKSHLGPQHSDLSLDDVSFIEQLLRIGICTLLYFEKDKDYFVVNGKIKKEGSSGRFEDFHSFYNYFLCKREKIESDFTCFKEEEKCDNQTTIEFFKSFSMISGTTATAVSVKKELKEFYDLDIVPIPPNIKPSRTNHPYAVFFSNTAKYAAIAKKTMEKHSKGQPVLIVTDSVSSSEETSQALARHNIPHMILNAKNESEEVRILEKSGEFGAVTVATALANRGVDIRLGGKPEVLTKNHLIAQGADPELFDEKRITDFYTKSEKSEFFETYRNILAFYRKYAEEARTRINNLGGLCVIGASCFNDLRIEQQMRGRCGRQGDKGESYVFFSFDDPNLCILLGAKYESFKNLCYRIDPSGEIAMESSVLDKAITHGRMKRQNIHFSKMLDIEEIHYRPYARGCFSELIQKLNDEPSYVNETISKYFSQSKQNEKEALSLIKGSNITNSRLSFLYPYISKHSANTGKINIHTVLDQACFDFISSNCITTEQIAQKLKLRIWVKWKKYLDTMKIETENVKNLFGDKPKKARQQLIQCSQALCVSLIEDAVAEAMRYCPLDKREE